MMKEEGWECGQDDEELFEFAMHERQYRDYKSGVAKERFNNDLEAARDFFIQYFNAVSNEGYHNKTTGFRSYFLSFEDGARLEIMKKPVMEDCEKTLTRTGYVHIAFSLGSQTAVDELSEKMRQDGYEIISGPRTTGDGYYESCIIGIEGNQIEITV